MHQIVPYRLPFLGRRLEKPRRCFQQVADASFRWRTDVAARHKTFNQFSDGEKGVQHLGRVGAVFVSGEQLAPRGVALPVDVAAADQQPPPFWVGEENQFGVGRTRGIDALSDVTLIKMAHQPTSGIMGARFKIALPISQDDLVATAGAKLPPQRVFEERSVQAVGQDECVVPGTFELLRQIEFLHVRSPSASKHCPSGVKG